MEGLYFIIAVVVLVFSVLQIILFFKVWNMTNNISHISDEIDDIKRELTPQRVKLARIEYLKGNENKAKELLDDCFFEELLNLCTSRANNNTLQHNEEKERRINNFVKKHEKLYSKMNIDMPDFKEYSEIANDLI